MPLILHGLELGALPASKARQATRYKRLLAPLTDNLALPESGLDSLCFPVVVARLEDVLGNPFSAVEDVRFPVTVGEFIRFYENAAK